MDKLRIAQAHTPLGATLMFRQFTGREDVSRLFEWQLELLADKNANVDPDAMLGKDITIELKIQDGGARFFNGRVTRFAFVGREVSQVAELWRYEARLRPWLWYLTRESDFRIFQNKTVPEILDEVFGKYQFPVEKKLGGGRYRKWEYCVQYQETDFNFVSRLMEHEGIYYFFKHEMDRHTLVLVNDLSKHEPWPGYETIPYMPAGRVAVADEECIDTWQIAKEVDSGTYITNDFDFEKPQAKLLRPRMKPYEHPHGDHPIYEWPGGYTDLEDGENYAKLRLEELQAPHESVTGQGDARGLAPGYLFSLKTCPRKDQNREYLILGVGYFVRDNPYHTGGEGPADWRFALTAQPTTVPYRPPRITPKPLTNGPQTAVVVGKAGEEIWTDKYGRVKVQFHWDQYGQADENSSCWIRVSHPWAGSNWGGMFMPRIGQEVIVDFINGDPDYPIITGRVYNADHMPPYALPKWQEYSTIKSHSTKHGGTTNWNELRFYDYKGKEQVFIHANWRMDVRVKWNMYETILESRYICVGKQYVWTVGGRNDHHVGGDHIQEVNGKKEYTVDGSLGIGVKGDKTELIRGKVELNGSQSITVEAMTSIVLKVGANFIEISPAGVTIQGMLTKINSGGGAAGTGDPDYENVADCEHADTGEPGYLDRPKKPWGGGPKKTKWKSAHAAPFTVTKDPKTGDLKLGNGITVKKDPNDPDFQDKALRDLTKIASTKSGSTTLNGIDQSGKQVTIGPHDPANPQNETADKNFKDSAPAGPTFFRNSKGEKVPYEGTGKGSDSDVHWKPDDGKTMSNGKERPSDVSLQHELSHADHMANGQRDTTDSTEPGFPDKEEQATIKRDNEYRNERDPSGKDIPQRKNHGDLG